MEIYLWDGSNRFFGVIDFKLDKMIFLFSERIKSSLKLEIYYTNIKAIHHCKLFGIEQVGLKITCHDGRAHFFISEDVQKIKLKFDNVLSKIY